jgi:hypothetical protein
MPVSLLRKVRVFTQVRVGGFSEVWPGGAQRSSLSTCRTDRAELYPPDLPFGGCPSTRPAIPSKAP